MIDPILIRFSVAFKHIRTIRETCYFLRAILTPQEIEQIPKRLECLRMIGEGEQRRKIAKNLKISTSTVTKMANIFGFLEFENPLWWTNFKKRHGIFVRNYYKGNQYRHIGWNR